MLDRPSAAACVFGHFEFLPDKRLLLRDGVSVPLTPKAFDTLAFLIANRDRVVAKDELLHHVWPDVAVEEGNLTQQIFLLRKALEDSSEGQQYIATVPRVGYRFVGRIRDVESAAASLVVHGGSRRGRLNRVLIAVGVLVLLATAAAVIVIAVRRSQGRALHYVFRQLTSEPGVESFPSLSADGLWFVYASGPIDYAGPSRIYLRRVSQEDAKDLSGNTNVSDTQPAISPDDEWIAFRSDRLGGGLFRIPSSGGQPLLIVNEGYNPSWSPDGKRIVYSTVGHGASPYARGRGGELRIADVESGAKTALKTGEALQPSWSPHGDRIAYWGDGAIYTVAASGGPPTILTTHPHGSRTIDWSPAWSPDARDVYFSSNRGGTFGLWRLAIDERSGEALGESEPVSTPSLFAAHVSFARAASGRFLFASLPTRSAIQRLPFDPETASVVGAATPVTKDTRGWVWPEPSPDGRLIACQSDVSKMAEDIYVGRTDGTLWHAITNDGTLDRAPRWSPDGSRVAFFSYRGSGDTANIWSINATGGELRQLTYSTKGEHIGFPVWAPDQPMKRMAATDSKRGALVFDMTRPWNPSTVQFLGAVDDTGTPMQAWSWSSDGTRLAGWCNRSESGATTTATTGQSRRRRAGIVVYSFETKEYEWVSDFGSTPVWLKDDRRLLFAFEDRLFVADTRTKAVKEVAAFGGARVAIAAGGGFSVTKDNRTIYVTPIVREGDIWMATAK